MTEPDAARRLRPRVLTQVRSRMRRVLRALGPAMAPARWAEGVRSGVGIALGLLVTGYLFHSELGLALGVEMIAPFGATALLVFGVPNSPLAQPWSAIVGNTVSALVGVSVVLLTPDPDIALPLSAGLALIAMGAARAMHPPGAAVALTAAMNPDAIAAVGFRFALLPVAAGTATLVLVSIAFTRATGRKYPFRQSDASGPAKTSDPEPMRRFGLSDDEIARLLAEFNQSSNIGVQDLARLLQGAQMRAASKRLGQMTAGDIMSRDVVGVAHDAPRADVAALFLERGVSALPVTRDGAVVGMIFHHDLLREGNAAASAADLTRPGAPVATPATAVGDLIPLLIEGRVAAVPVLAKGRLAGIVSRADLIAALARRVAERDPAPDMSKT